ncbi:MAG: lipoprotein [Ramlibacter sp.]|jgi:outer membrane protein assembly factor BamE (lipoprotein component of BamABCDE complex)|uniref:outer membrane protein assembly factor BamE domain-containing protein n=1 Tax=Ramlibacter sp. TaxID=1917967 RepID=UPI00262FD258|nr:outer membrane protein assembly factor BamE [Ramlibacter sp.]MDB5752421.1 lipoprotein [Ramlibacter sp.]
MTRMMTAVALVAAVLALAGCDQQRIEQLEEGVATEASVRQQFGQPHATYSEPDGSTTFEYSRQPEGQLAYMITIGPDGKMSALRQVLTRSEFAKVVPGMDTAQVRRVLGRPASTARYDLKPDEERWDWRWLDGQAAKVFSVTFDRDGKVVSTATTEDPREVLKPA